MSCTGPVDRRYQGREHRESLVQNFAAYRDHFPIAVVVAFLRLADFHRCRGVEVHWRQEHQLVDPLCRRARVLDPRAYPAGSLIR